MSKIIVIGDVHLDEQSIPELTEIFNELMQVEDTAEYWFLGDVFHKKRPSPLEYNFITKLFIDLQTKAPVHIISGNHDAITNTVTALDYTRHFGINLYNDTVVMTRNNKPIYLGHHFSDKGDQYRKNEKYKVSELSANYELTLLGHDHSFRHLADNVYHLGSLRRVSFGEVEYNIPCYALIDSESLQIQFKELKSVIPMHDVYSIEEALKMPSRAKIRLVFRSFEEFMNNVDNIGKIQDRFEQFTIKHDYEKTYQAKEKEEKSDTKSFDEVFYEYLNKVENPKVQKLLKEVWNA